jgi:hypothetical protein
MKNQDHIQEIVREIALHQKRADERLTLLEKGNRKWVDKFDMSRLLNVSVRTIDRYKKQRLVSFAKHGGKTYFNIPDFENYLDANCVRNTPRL